MRKGYREGPPARSGDKSNGIRPEEMASHTAKTTHCSTKVKVFKQVCAQGLLRGTTREKRGKIKRHRAGGNGVPHRKNYTLLNKGESFQASVCAGKKARAQRQTSEEAKRGACAKANRTPLPTKRKTGAAEKGKKGKEARKRKKKEEKKGEKRGKKSGRNSEVTLTSSNF